MTSYCWPSRCDKNSGQAEAEVLLAKNGSGRKKIRYLMPCVPVNCFDTTDWNMFKQAATYNNTTDLQEYTETVTAYITKCIDDVTVTKTITVRANQKPWLTGEVYRLLNARNAAFRAGDEEGLRTARANLSRGIREAKRQYSRRIAHPLGACGREYRPLRTTSPHHRPVTAPSSC